MEPVDNYLLARVAALEALVVALLAERLASGGTLERHATVERLAQDFLHSSGRAERLSAEISNMASGWATTLDESAVSLARTALMKLG